jgi:hypothetical protein
MKKNLLNTKATQEWFGKLQMNFSIRKEKIESYQGNFSKATIKYYTRSTRNCKQI